MMTSPLPERLHLGCGGFAVNGWLNSDGSWHVWLARWPRVRRVAIACGLLPHFHIDHPWPQTILHLDLRRKLPFPDNHFTAIYASHVLEHLERQAAVALLREARRCCRPGGVIRMAVPNLSVQVNDYLQGRILPEAPGHTPADTLLHRLHFRPAVTTGGRFQSLRRLYHHLYDFNSHKWGYDSTSLTALFREAGLSDALERQLLDSAIADISAIERPERIGDGGTLIVEAIKRDS
ncbi:class I SAM-dependent methyltransferase [Candidatus Magnetaquicoccus inordinatus]|uniref:class I SAM-dependent methyltransferase n=1 Tax=Candidatus Magnetaquicoccus inordinatus TaxID=2496818 RepID=UPI00102B9B93|nr:methyltransferase domain-containing protein [Candidatus Magnetaquicoccus inordinatus]